MTMPRIAKIVLTVCVLAVHSAGAAANSASAYPRAAREIPSEFRGTWDEQNCGIREVRYRLTARRLFNFEAGYDVLKVTLRAPNLIVVTTRADPEVGGRKFGTWAFRLANDGKALSESGGSFINRCSFG